MSLQEYARKITRDTLISVISYNSQNPQNSFRGIIFFPDLGYASKALDRLPVPEALQRLQDLLPHTARLVTERHLAQLPDARVIFTYIPLESIVQEHYWQSFQEGSSAEERARISPDGIPMPPIR